VTFIRPEVAPTAKGGAQPVEEPSRPGRNLFVGLLLGIASYFVYAYRAWLLRVVSELIAAVRNQQT
jgi:hypothetical protein